MSLEKTSDLSKTINESLKKRKSVIVSFDNTQPEMVVRFFSKNNTIWWESSNKTGAYINLYSDLGLKKGARFRVVENTNTIVNISSEDPKIEDGQHGERVRFVDKIDLRGIARKVIDNAVRKILKNDGSSLSGLSRIRDRLKADKEVLELFNEFIRLAVDYQKETLRRGGVNHERLFFAASLFLAHVKEDSDYAAEVQGLRKIVGICEAEQNREFVEQELKSMKAKYGANLSDLLNLLSVGGMKFYTEAIKPSMECLLNSFQEFKYIRLVSRRSKPREKISYFIRNSATIQKLKGAGFNGSHLSQIVYGQDWDKKLDYFTSTAKGNDGKTNLERLQEAGFNGSHLSQIVYNQNWDKKLDYFTSTAKGNDGKTNLERLQEAGFNGYHLSQIVAGANWDKKLDYLQKNNLPDIINFINKQKLEKNEWQVFTLKYCHYISKRLYTKNWLLAIQNTPLLSGVKNSLNDIELKFHEFNATKGRDSSMSWTAKYFGLDEDLIKILIATSMGNIYLSLKSLGINTYNMAHVSLDAGPRNDGGRTLGEMVGSEDSGFTLAETIVHLEKLFTANGTNSVPRQYLEELAETYINKPNLEKIIEVSIIAAGEFFNKKEDAIANILCIARLEPQNLDPNFIKHIRRTTSQ
jgi:hypothetical protein